MRIKVESAGKIFAIRHSSDIRISEKRLSATEYQLEVRRRDHLLTVRISPELYQRLVEVSKRENMTLSEITRKALSQYLRQFE